MQVPAMAAMGLTKGARRRLQQRLRKKLGRKARQEQLAMAEMVPHTMPVHDVCIDLRLLQAHNAACPPVMLPGSTVPTGGSMMVPVCALQVVPRLEEAPQADVADALVPLPAQPRKDGWRPPAPPAEDAAGQVPRLVGARASGDAAGAPRRGNTDGVDGKPVDGLPTVNTFVHFRDAQAPRRRSHSA